MKCRQWHFTCVSSSISNAKNWDSICIDTIHNIYVYSIVYIYNCIIGISCGNQTWLEKPRMSHGGFVRESHRTTIGYPRLILGMAYSCTYLHLNISTTNSFHIDGI